MKKQPAKKQPAKRTPAHQAAVATAPLAPSVAPHLISVGGKTMTVVEWARAAGGKLPESLQRRRLSVLPARTAPPDTPPNPPNPPKAPAAPALQARDLDAVFDALVIGGCPRGKTWVMSFLKAGGHRHERGAMLPLVEVTRALQR